jgi:hypothetical protein
VGCLCFVVAGEEDDPGKWGMRPGLPFLTGKILNRYNYRFYAPQRMRLQAAIKEQKRTGVDSMEGVTKSAKGCRTPRLPEVYCVNKKKWFSSASPTEMTSPLDMVAGVASDNVHRILQCRLR